MDRSLNRFGAMSVSLTKLDFAIKIFSNVSPLMVIHDHYPVHTARAVKHWLENKSNILVLDEWPRNFEDLMPLENFGELLKQKLLTYYYNFIHPSIVDGVVYNMGS
ncbi:Uncharacterized protein APZ42_033532 [Daphnia magna]|uniref:Tc1-like transposase DDE domain-containing protein n=1 Tax=Daphnia magna TaxID=35525 RepID=A0A164L053_9CRUS|nr:Uncharacterized protein APZ42_033532 [Daphnia magna]